tara:strand:+ start:11019 stop:12347 length:1329 start_codon:yes stop_codon:yes gene_type:complete
MELEKSSNFTPLDSVVTCNGYEQAVTTLGALQSGIGSQISPEMIVSLDNFIKIFLFSENLHVYGYVAEGMNEREVLIRSEPIFRNAGRSEHDYLIKEKAIHVDTFPFEAHAVEKIEKFMKLDSIEHALYSRINLEFPNIKTNITQEILTMDLVFQEQIIESYGERFFKVIFPSESMYLGMRKSGHTNYSVSEIVSDKIKSSFREKMSKINALQKKYGGLSLPALPPVFLLRLLCEKSANKSLAEALVKLKRGKEFAAFRQQALKCHEMIEDQDIKKREEATKIIEYLLDYNFDQQSDPLSSGKRIIKYAKVLFKTLGGSFVEPIEELVDLSNSLYKEIEGRPYSILKDFSVGNLDSELLHSFTDKKVGDKLHMDEMKVVGFLLGLPDYSEQWEGLGAEISIKPSGLLVPSAPNSRHFLCEASSITFTEADIKLLHKEMFGLY